MNFQTHHGFGFENYIMKTHAPHILLCISVQQNLPTVGVYIITACATIS